MPTRGDINTENPVKLRRHIKLRDGQIGGMKRVIEDLRRANQIMAHQLIKLEELYHLRLDEHIEKARE